MEFAQRMESINHTARQDRAIEDSQADALERKPFVASLVRTLVHTELDADGKVTTRRATGFVVGLTGEWGLGKSSVLNMLSEEFRTMDEVVVATLNPWLFKGRDELMQAYFNSLRDALGQSTSEKAKALQGQLERYKTAIEVAGSTAAGIVDIFIGGGVTTVFWKRWIVQGLKGLLKPKDLSVNQERKALETKLGQENVAVVVLIDELDRVEDEEVRAVAQLVKAVGDIKGISYLVAYDPERVTQALGRGDSAEDRRRTGESYLEKIIQFAIPLRPLFNDDARALLQVSLRNNGVVLPVATARHQTEIFDELLRVVRTPREIKRLIGAFSVLEEMLRDEICPYDLLGYCWLVAKSPGLRQLIADNVQELVDDPGLEELSRRMAYRRESDDSAETLVGILGNVASAHLAIISLMFPRFQADRQLSEDHSDGNRIAKRRNLIRLLYLGNPPGTLSRRDIEALWSLEDPATLAHELRQLIQGDRIDDLLDRIEDLLPALPRSGDCNFWVAMSHALTRTHDWITDQDSTGRLVDDSSTLLWRLARAVPDGRRHVRAVVESLIQAGDLLIAPWILRKHLFAHGLTPYPVQSNNDEIYNQSETVALQQREIPRYRAAVVDGIVLRRLPDTETFYCLINSRQWDETLRSSLTSQLNSWEAVSTFAALITPPGVRTSRSNLEEMLDLEIFSPVIAAMLNDNRSAGIEWLTTSVRRLAAMMDGRDPDHGPSDDVDQDLADG
ncbi:KAP family NTPase [Pseudomonas fluorescens]|nr:KAP family NTPase [Pseudomonas fluorescens]